MKRHFVLDLLPGSFGIYRLPPGSALPDLGSSHFVSVTSTATELSVITSDDVILAAPKTSTGWRLLRIRGPLDLSLVGVLAETLEPIRVAGVSILAISTFDTDYILVPASGLDRVVAGLVGAGHTVLLANEAG